MKKFNKSILSLVLALVLFAVAIFPVAAVGESEEPGHVHDETCTSETVASELNGGGGFWLFATCNHWYQFYSRIQKGTSSYGSDDYFCYTVKEKWEVAEKCYWCGDSRTYTEDGEIIVQERHHYIQNGPIVYADEYVLIYYKCDKCGYEIVDKHPRF